MEADTLVSLLLRLPAEMPFEEQVEEAARRIASGEWTLTGSMRHVGREVFASLATNDSTAREGERP